MPQDDNSAPASSAARLAGQADASEPASAAAEVQRDQAGDGSHVEGHVGSVRAGAPEPAHGAIATRFAWRTNRARTCRHGRRVARTFPVARSLYRCVAAGRGPNGLVAVRSRRTVSPRSSIHASSFERRHLSAPVTDTLRNALDRVGNHLAAVFEHDAPASVDSDLIEIRRRRVRDRDRLPVGDLELEDRQNVDEPVPIE